MDEVPKTPIQNGRLRGEGKNVHAHSSSLDPREAHELTSISPVKGAKDREREREALVSGSGHGSPGSGGDSDSDA